MRTIAAASIAAASVAIASIGAIADAQVALRVTEAERLRVDGALGDWRGAHFTNVGEGADAALRFAIAYDGDGLYVGAEVSDERLVRTARPGASEDAVILSIAPARGAAVDLFLFAGESGRSAARAAVAPIGSSRLRPAPDVRVVEGPLARGRGYTLEAFVPRALLGGAQWEEARASIRLRDVDQEARPTVEAEPSLVERTSASTLLPLSLSGGETGALAQFLASRNLIARPRHDLRGDVAADARPERVFVVDRYVVVTGEGFRPDGGYAYHQLPIDEPGDVRSAELVDLTGDGKAELAIVLRQRNANGERDLWQALSLNGGTLRPLFAIEVRKATGAGSIASELRVQRRGRAATIEVRAGRADGLDATTFREAPASDAEPILLPWGPVLERSYRWDGQRFARAAERENPRYEPPTAARRAPVSPRTEPAPTSTAPSTAAPSSEALLAGFRRARGIARNVRPRFTLSANLAGDPQPETVHVYGRQLAAVGPGIQNGQSWLFYEIPAASDADLLAVEAFDATGDGRAEIVLRIRQTLGDVEREVLLVHRLADEGFPRLLQVEVARTRGDATVRNEVRFQGGNVEIAPGRARGWDAATWPFGATADDSVEPLLLPWRDRPVRYRLRAGRLQR